LTATKKTIWQIRTTSPSGPPSNLLTRKQVRSHLRCTATPRKDSNNGCTTPRTIRSIAPQLPSHFLQMKIRKMKVKIRMKPKKNPSRFKPTSTPTPTEIE